MLTDYYAAMTADLARGGAPDGRPSSGTLWCPLLLCSAVSASPLSRQPFRRGDACAFGAIGCERARDKRR